MLLNRIFAKKYFLLTFSLLVGFSAFIILQENGFSTGISALSLSLPLFPAFVGLVAIIKPHFHWKYIFYSVLLWIGWEVIEGDHYIAWLYSEGNPQWATVTPIVAIGLTLAVITIFHKTTLFRAIASSVIAAQIIALPAFHILTISSPFEIEESLIHQERGRLLTHDTLNIDQYCNLNQLDCYEGNTLSLLNQVNNIEINNIILKTIKDAHLAPSFYFNWHEINIPANPTSLDGLRFVTLIKNGSNTLLIIDEKVPTQKFKNWSFNFGLLAVLFHIVWISGMLYISNRHKSYVYINKRWKPSA